MDEAEAAQPTLHELLNVAAAVAALLGDVARLRQRPLLLPPHRALQRRKAFATACVDRLERRRKVLLK